MHELLAMLQSGAEGRLALRQSTYWDVCVSPGKAPAPTTLFRVHFDLKQEFAYPVGSFSHAELFDDHPLLLDYSESHRQVFISGAAADAASVLAEVRAEVQHVTDGWRSLTSYANSHFDLAVILQEGSGKLLQAPVTVTDVVAAVLEASGVRFTVLPGRPARGPFRALVLGRGFVIARGFRLELRQ